MNRYLVKVEYTVEIDATDRESAIDIALDDVPYCIDSDVTDIDKIYDDNL